MSPGGGRLGSRYSASLRGTATLVWADRVVNRAEGAHTRGSRARARRALALPEDGRQWPSCHE